MRNHLRANLWLLVSTVLLCSVAYPLALWAIGQMAFHDLAQGSIVKDANGKAIGSRLIAQEFKGDGYFQSRPSAVAYKGEASGASNWGASNYLLRDRVARQLGPMVRYGKGAEKDGKTPGELVGNDIDQWFQKQEGIVAKWAALHGTLAEQWLKETDSALKEQWKIGDKEAEPGQSFLRQLGKDDAQLSKDVAAAPAAGTAELAKNFFTLFSRRYPGQWLVVEDVETPDKQKRKQLKRIREGADIQAVFFDMWRQHHPEVALEEVPADMVMASASGLDPHITLKNAQYQLKHRIAEARARLVIVEQARKLRPDFDTLDESGRKPIETQARTALEDKVGKRLESRLAEVIDELLNGSASAPLGGLVGVPLINVLEINLALDGRVKTLVDTGK